MALPSVGTYIMVMYIIIMRHPFAVAVTASIEGGARVS
jgi:hypothetical protein